MKAFWKITFPALASPASPLARCLCFIPAVGEFVIPDLLGGSDTLMIGKESRSGPSSTVNRSWTVSSAVAVLLLARAGDPHRDLPEHPAARTGGRQMRKGLTWFNVTSIVLGFAFLYIPIILLVIYSFNASRLVTVWAGFSTQWY